jgi:hypothetical protein
MLYTMLYYVILHFHPFPDTSTSDTPRSRLGAAWFSGLGDPLRSEARECAVEPLGLGWRWEIPERNMEVLTENHL